MYQEYFSNRYKIFTAISLFQALETLSYQSIHVIVVESEIILLQGKNFFSKLHSAWHCPSIVLSADEDLEKVISLTKEEMIYSILDKTLYEFELRAAIDGAYQFYLNEEELKLFKAHFESFYIKWKKIKVNINSTNHAESKLIESFDQQIEEMISKCSPDRISA
jgi:response regulator RpfG family c-di-GMP phosphodiesterase